MSRRHRFPQTALELNPQAQDLNHGSSSPHRSQSRSCKDKIEIKWGPLLCWLVNTVKAHLFLDSPGLSRAGYNQENEQAPSVDMSPVLRERCLIQGVRWEKQMPRLASASFPSLTLSGTMSIRARLRGSSESFYRPRSTRSTSRISQ